MGAKQLRGLIMYKRHVWIFTALALAFLFLTCPASAVADESKLLGTWTGQHKDEELTFTFKSDNQFQFVSKGVSFGGTYKVDYSQTPIQLDLNMKMGDKTQTSLTILEFLEDGRMRMEEPGNTRPTGFDSSPVMFTRQGETPAAAEQPELKQPEPEKPAEGQSQEFKAVPFKSKQ